MTRADCCVPAAILLTVCGLAAQTARPEPRGKQIYTRGLGRSGQPIATTIAEQRNEVPASVVPCLNCHGEDGRGKSEGGIVVPNIRWEALTTPYTLARPGGRTSPPYTERALVRAITMGLDPAGNRLNPVMPRYQLSLDEAADLVAYLKEIGSDQAPGVTSRTIRIGVLLPPAAFGEAGVAVQSLLSAYFRELNDAGGIYDRRVELSFADSSARAAVVDLLDREPPFALAATYLPSIDDFVGQAVVESDIPVIGALTLDPRPESTSKIFYADGGLLSQAETLAYSAVRRRGAGRMLVVYSGEALSRRAAEAAERVGRDAQWQVESVVLRSGDPAESTARAAATDAVIYVALQGEAGTFVQSAASGTTAASFYIPGTLTSPAMFDLPPSLDGRVFVSFTALPSDRTSRGLTEYRRLASVHDPLPNSSADAMSALVSAKLLTEALQRAGHDLTRRKLIEAMESLHEFSTGLTPPLTFGAGRRIGSIGTHIVTLDLASKRGVPRSVWIEPN
jgi:ABC-type branched-subunit amino acid transport system substrate-binding protein